MTEAVRAATLQARALCIQAALVTRREASTPETIIATAEAYWGWVSQPDPADNRAEPDRLTERKRSR